MIFEPTGRSIAVVNVTVAVPMTPALSDVGATELADKVVDAMTDPAIVLKI